MCPTITPNGNTVLRDRYGSASVVRNCHSPLARGFDGDWRRLRTDHDRLSPNCSNLRCRDDKAVYDSMLARSKQAEHQTALPPTEARIVGPAMVPGAPGYPDRQRFIILGLLGGLVLGAGAAFLLENLESGFLTVEQTEQILSVPVYAVVPHLAEGQREVDGKPVLVHEYSVHKPLSYFGESIRTARVSTNMSDVVHPPRLIQVTSTAPSEGKTTIALALAYSAAAANQRVLMVDCDLRHPSTTKLLNMSDRPGLSDLLLGQVTAERAFFQGALPTLTILPAGSTTRNPPDLIGSERMRQLLGMLREAYDLVIIDAPPVTPVIDSAMLSKLVDKVVFVVRWRATPRDLVQRAIQAIDNPSHKVAGIILNNGDLKLMSSYAYYGYGYAYGYYNKAYSKYYSD